MIQQTTSLLLLTASSGLFFGNPKLNQTTVRKPKRIRLSFPVKAIAAGNFLPESRKGLAVLSKSGKIHAIQFLKSQELKWEKKVISRGSWPSATQLIRTRMTGNPLDDLAILTGNQFQLLSVSRSRYEPVDTFSLPGDFADALSVKLNIAINA